MEAKAVSLPVTAELKKEPRRYKMMLTLLREQDLYRC